MNNGTRLSFRKTEPRKQEIKWNERHGCFDPYWGNVNHTKLGINDVYVYFEGLHQQVEELVDEINKRFRFINVELLHLEDKTAYIYNGNYGESVISHPKTSKDKEFKYKDGVFKITVTDTLLKTNNHKRIAMHMIYVIHHVLQLFAISEGWLTASEKYSKIDVSKYGGYLEFICNLNNTRNKGVRSLKEGDVTVDELLQFNSLEKIEYFAKHDSNNFGHQTGTITKFSTPLSVFRNIVFIKKNMDKFIKENLINVGDYFVLDYTDEAVRKKSSKSKNPYIGVVDKIDSGFIFYSFIGRLKEFNSEVNEMSGGTLVKFTPENCFEIEEKKNGEKELKFSKKLAQFVRQIPRKLEKEDIDLIKGAIEYIKLKQLHNIDRIDLLNERLNRNTRDMYKKISTESTLKRLKLYNERAPKFIKDLTKILNRLEKEV